MRIVDWLARTTMLVLASMATLALIGALANVSNSPLAETLPGASVRPGELPPIVGDEPASAISRDRTGPDAGVGNTQASRAVAPAPSPLEREQVRWLRALTYAVVALAAFAAAAVVALNRIAAHLSRLAAR
ncbi:hypothetical protein SAMN06297144_0984 [Sphingomonas guangdongensis]|uniref:Uncharacterized protein n=1 Tax=Sphingomonas guangdongensis TaxID=1141890 RepID=A0A285QFI4_9SPHN|nr:hypothetical protein [Sphingomonas guangdongensis]SOB80288.1 hypothetical protein SAMN06297144_0984 [Sphingomonas guangdongensis]